MYCYEELLGKGFKTVSVTDLQQRVRVLHLSAVGERGCGQRKDLDHKPCTLSIVWLQAYAKQQSMVTYVELLGHP